MNYNQATTIGIKKPIHKKESDKLYAALSYHLLNSTVYRKIQSKYPNAIAIYLGFQKRLIKKRQTVLGKQGKRNSELVTINDKNLIYPYESIMEEIDCKSRSTVTRNMDVLVNYGLIDIIKYGGLGKGHFTIYGLSERWKKWGKPDFEKKCRQKGTRHSDALKRYQKKRKESFQPRTVPVPVTAMPRVYKIHPDGTIERLKGIPKLIRQLKNRPTAK